jgi:hypothetical protein
LKASWSAVLDTAPKSEKLRATVRSVVAVVKNAITRVLMSRSIASTIRSDEPKRRV